MSAFVANTNGQYLSQRAGQVSTDISHVEGGTPIKVTFWRWQFWNERGKGEYDSIYLTVGDARELAYGILEQLGKVQNNGTQEPSATPEDAPRNPGADSQRIGTPPGSSTP